MEIDWSKAPKWAQYFAMGADGVACWYEKHPLINKMEEIWTNEYFQDKWEEDSNYFEIFDSNEWDISLYMRPATLKQQIVTHPDNPTPSHYNHTLNGVKVDPYKIADIYNITSHPQFHALKKILRAHQPNHKSLEQNIDEAISALQRWKEIINE